MESEEEILAAVIKKAAENQQRVEQNIKVAQEQADADRRSVQQAQMDDERRKKQLWHGYGGGE